MRIGRQELGARIAAFAAGLAAAGLDGAVLFDAARILYYTGFAFVPTERPIVLAVAADGRCGLLLPRLELEHAESESAVSEIEHYPEYPGDEHPLRALPRLLARLGVDGRIGADGDGYPWILGYRGPTLTELSGRTPEGVTRLV
jgi:Xaa-Pro dipeptidase